MGGLIEFPNKPQAPKKKRLKRLPRTIDEARSWGYTNDGESCHASPDWKTVRGIAELGHEDTEMPNLAVPFIATYGFGKPRLYSDVPEEDRNG